MLWPVHGSAGLHQSLRSGYGMGASEGRAPSRLPGRLTGGSGVEGPPPTPSGPSSPLCCNLGIMVNWKKSDLVPSTCLQYLGMVLDTSLEWVFPSQDRLSRFREVATSFLLLPSPPARMWQWLLGHMSLLEHFLPGGCTHMQPLQWQMKDHLPPVDGDCIEAVRWWLNEDQWKQGVPPHILPLSLSLYADASLSGWGAHLLDLTASGVWSEEESVELALASFLPQLAGQSVLMSDNALVVAYLRHQGGTISH